MKKFLSIVLAAAMVMAMSVTAFAGEKTFDALPDSQDIDVYIRLDTDGDGIPDLEDDTPYGESICIDLAWPDDEVVFTYSMSWNSDAAKFDNGTWQESDYDITITNRSTVGVTAVLSYANVSTAYGLVFTQSALENATFDGATNTVVLENPVELTPDENGVYPLSFAVITVTPDENAAVPEADSDDPVGTITVTISRTPEWSEKFPIVLNQFETFESVFAHENVSNRGYYYIGAANQFEVTFSPRSDGATDVISGVEARDLDGNPSAEWAVNDGTIKNNGAAGTYYIKISWSRITPKDTGGQSVESYNAYFLIKQDAATT